MISIIIPVYNQAKYIDKCLKSIFAQTYKDFEVIIVNDGSTDNLLSILRSWNTKVKIINQKNQGAPVARNIGFGNASGDYLLFCDADLVLKPDMLQMMMSALENNPKGAYAYCSFKYGFKKFKLWKFDAEKLKEMPYIHTTSLIRIERFPGFDEDLKKFQDWDLWLTILESGYEGVWIDAVLFKTTDGGSMSRWLPSFVFKLPFKFSSWGREVERYEKAMEIIKKKHKLN